MDNDRNLRYREVDGDLIQLATEKHFDAIIHGCNCKRTMGAGIAAQIARRFPGAVFADNLYVGNLRANIDALGNYSKSTVSLYDDPNSATRVTHKFDIINAYTQYEPGRDFRPSALMTVLTKVNRKYKGKKIGLPLIGCGIGGGYWGDVKEIIQSYLKDCYVTVVHFK